MFTIFRVMFPFFCVSVVVYLIFLFTIAKNKKKDDFKTAFFTFALLLGCQDLEFVLSSWFFIKFPLLGWFGIDRLVRKHSELMVQLYTFINTHALGGQQIGLLLMTIDRYSAICKWQHHHAFWTKRRIMVVLALQLTLPIPPSLFHTFETGLVYGINNVTGQITPPFYHNPVATMILQISIASLVALNNMTMFVLYIRMYLFVRKQVAQVVQMGQESGVKNTDKKLACYGFSLFVVNSTYGITSSLFSFASPVNTPVLFQVAVITYMIGGDVLAYCNPYFTLLFSETVRKHYLAFVFCRSPPE